MTGYVWWTLACLALFVATCSSNTDFPFQRLKRQSTCTQNEFKCANGECTASYNVCDGAKDCSDGSDEEESTCKDIRCPTLAYRCAYGACVDKAARCDGKMDCADGSDERCDDITSSTCQSGSFKCANSQCVNQYAVCDGVKDCSDGSDETKEICQNLTCPPNSFQCDYGACLEQSVKCNGIVECLDNSDERCGTSPAEPPSIDRPLPGGCKLPEHPKFGVYESWQCRPGDTRTACRNIPGTPVPAAWSIKYSCNTNYNLSSSSNEISICYNGVWKNSLDCIKLCEPLQSLSVDVRCVYQGREIPCDQPMKPDTWARASCRPHYREKKRPNYSRLSCLSSGEWSDDLFSCEPECGIAVASGMLTTLILHGEPARSGEYPWLVALYLRKSERDKWEQQCAGTLITPHIVLTAAHCVVVFGRPIKPETVKVGLGKYYRDFNVEENTSIFINVREVVVPQYYAGESNYYALDIALLDLAVSVQMTSFIRPACVDWTSRNTYPNNIGHVAGWGTTENMTSSETVLKAELQYFDNIECRSKVRQAFRPMVSPDKFCADTNKDGSQVAKGDSGGGFTAVDSGQHFVIGIVSTKIPQTTFSFFTNVSNTEHLTWLEENKIRLESLHREL